MPVDVRYLVDDVEAAAAFYLRHLGFSEEGEWEGAPFRMLRRGDLRLWISGPAARPRGPCPTAPHLSRAAGTASSSRSTTSRPRSRACATPASAFRSEIVSGPGGKQAVLDDPAGNPVELFQPAS